MDKSEYELQHFGFSVEQLSLERRHYLNKILTLSLQSMIEKLSLGNIETKKLLTQKMDDVKGKMLEAMEKNLLELEELDRKTFSIPEYVLLATDNSLSKQYSETEVQEMDQLIKQKKIKILENSVMIASLKMENENFAAVLRETEMEEKVRRQVQETVNKVYTQFKKAQTLVQETKSLETM